MNSLRVINILFRVDSLTFFRWWKRRFVSNSLISLAFFLVFILISIFIYASSYTFLLPLTRYEIFGKQTATYLVHAAIIITLWLGVASSFVSNLSFLFSRNQAIDYINTLPVKPFSIVLYSFIKSILSSLVWTLFIFLPLGLVTQRLFINTINLNSILNLILVISIVVMLSTIFGVILSNIYSKFSHSFHSAYHFFGMTLIFIFMTVYLIRLILPPALGSLISLPIEKFQNVFSSLPLNQYFVPTLYLTKLIFINSSPLTFVSLILILIICIASLFAVSNIYTNIRQPLSSISYKSKKSLHPLATITLVKKDIYSLLRNQSEMGYGLFLLGLIAGFFYFFYTSAHKSFVQSLGWFLFYTLAFFLRLVFPLMAREGKMAWFIFTKPISPAKILIDKLVSGLIISLPIFVLGVFLSMLTNFSYAPLLGTISLFLIISLMGNIFPNFKEADNSERVSTSFMGISALILGLAFVYFLTQPKPISIAVIYTFLVTTTLLVCSLVSISHYRF